MENLCDKRDLYESLYKSNRELSRVMTQLAYCHYPFIELLKYDSTKSRLILYTLDNGSLVNIKELKDALLNNVSSNGIKRMINEEVICSIDCLKACFTGLRTSYDVRQKISSIKRIPYIHTAKYRDLLGHLELGERDPITFIDWLDSC
jgi:hypothetical protein